MHIQGVNHLLFSVSDLQRSIAFYRDALGARLLAEGRKLAYFDLAGIWLALNVEEDIPRRDIHLSYTHLAFTVAEAELPAWEHRLREHGVTILESRERDPRDRNSIYFTDPDGHKFELHTGTLQNRLQYYRSAMPHMKFYER
ncbi:fosfomycin resistance protein FosB [Gordoniibacillus kamchatkensis]|uniref:Metallothiol transferase FosB n=1 Tax=Gordoniibacillus kamchatkensis TaxID=1590651 RepID=A0ABR5AG38_9BACL|nr:metallothiol transferase FosB [Paenibacillus sp. VKM B-2647]KIL39788.1 fosfomycin resistance protein FosB [Paenibacillus sp. VKM B-2647]